MERVKERRCTSFIGIPLGSRTLESDYSTVISHRRGTRIGPPIDTVLSVIDSGVEIEEHQRFGGHHRVVPEKTHKVGVGTEIVVKRFGVKRIFTFVGPKIS